ncbi:MAG: type II toxin-antitoxin system Phd/YefM family antitoxin [Spongiibacteraceae bacterium]
MTTITANDLKTKGISVVEADLAAGEDVIITVRGQSKYVVMDMAKYEKLREYELEMAVHEARADYAAGRFVSESAADHIKRLDDDVTER